MPLSPDHGVRTSFGVSPFHDNSSLPRGSKLCVSAGVQLSGRHGFRALHGSQFLDALFLRPFRLDLGQLTIFSLVLFGVACFYIVRTD